MDNQVSLIFFDVAAFAIKCVAVIMTTCVILSCCGCCCIGRCSRSTKKNKKSPIELENRNLKYDALAMFFTSKTKNNGPESKYTYLINLKESADFENISNYVDAIVLSQRCRSDDESGLLVSDDKISDEIVIIINCPGGSCTEFGNYFTELYRLKKLNIPIKVFIQEVGASGGYMMALVGDEIYATHLATVGSIGVVMSSFNFADIMKKYGLKYDEFTSGDKKRLYTQFGDNTEESVTFLKNKLKEIHTTFIKLVRENRPVSRMTLVLMQKHGTMKMLLKWV